MIEQTRARTQGRDERDRDRQRDEQHHSRSATANLAQGVPESVARQNHVFVRASRRAAAIDDSVPSPYLDTPGWYIKDSTPAGPVGKMRPVVASPLDDRAAHAWMQVHTLLRQRLVEPPE